MLTILAVVGFAATANGASYQMEFGNNGVYDNGPREIWLVPSDYGWIEVWLLLGPGESMSSFTTDLSVTYVPGPGDWVWTSLAVRGKSPLGP